MDAFGLLRYWRRGDGAAHLRTTIINATASDDPLQPAREANDGDDGGPFFDMEFTVPCKGDGGGEADDEYDGGGESSGDTDEERGFGFTGSSSSAGGDERSESNPAISPSGGLFFKGQILPLDASEAPTFRPPPHFPARLLKSATRFRVFLLGFKKPKPLGEASNGPPGSPQRQQQNRLFAVKMVEEITIGSLLTRENSARSPRERSRKHHRHDSADEGGGISDSESDSRRFAKVLMRKYLKRIKPLYVKISKRYGEKLRFSGHPEHREQRKTAANPVPTPESDSGDTLTTVSAGTKTEKQVNVPTGLRVVCRHLGKSRSASAAVAAAPPMACQQQRRDDSLRQQQDGIQSAIAHCKRSFNASEEWEISLSRSCSNPCADFYFRNSSEEIDKQFYI